MKIAQGEDKPKVTQWEQFILHPASGWEVNPRHLFRSGMGSPLCISKISCLLKWHSFAKTESVSDIYLMFSIKGSPNSAKHKMVDAN